MLEISCSAAGPYWRYIWGVYSVEPEIVVRGWVVVSNPQLACGV